jgi:hypothetical protein
MEVAAAFMAGEAAASMVEGASAAEVACAPAAEAGSVAGRLRHPLPAIEVQVPRRAQGASLLRGQATTILDPVVISRAGISALEIPPRLPVRSPTAGGIPSEAHQVAADLRALHRNPGRQVTQVASTSLTGIAEPDQLDQFAAFRARAAKFGRMLPPREMLFPDLNRFPPFTIRSAARPLRIPGSGRTRPSPRLRALAADRRSWAIEDFRVV